MKRLYLLMPLIAAQYCSLAQNRFTPAKDFTQQPPAGNWYQNAMTALDNQQNNFRRLDEKTFGAVNRSNNFGCFITAKGYSVKPVKENNWESSFELLSVNGAPYNSSKAIATMDKQNLLFKNPAMTVEYVNNKQGIRQNFIINKKSTAAKLSLAVKITTALQASLHNNQLLLKDNRGITKLMYDELMVWDANHTLLHASMQLSGGILTIVVEDENAQYPVTIDPLNHTPDWTDSGNGMLFPLLNDLAVHGLYGFSVSSAGDINNDGYDDVVIGSPAFVDIISVSGGTYNLLSVGAAFVYYGSAGGLPLSPNEVLQPTTFAGALFGYSVSTAGDVNGDGYKDIVVGAPGDHITLNIGIFSTPTDVVAGKVYVYYGGPAGTFDGNVATTPTVSATVSLFQSDFGSLLSAPANPLYGFSVSTAGDVNGDGKADILVGSPAYSRLLPLPIQAGRVDVYYGSAAGISAASKTTISGTLLSALFGFSVSSAGNVNNDKNGIRNIDDIIVGAPGSLTIAGAGQAYIFQGSTSGITATSVSGASTTLNSGLLTTLFGLSVTNAGDVNGDGYNDVAVGEPAALENVLSQLISVGAVHVYYGSATGIKTTGSTTLNSPHRPSVLGSIEGNLLFGFSVKGAGDLNCDGIADLVVGEPGGTSLSLGSGLLGLVSTNSVSGRAYIFYGKMVTGPVSSPGYTIEQSGALTAANLIGYSVSGAGDVNGDGRQDLLIGAPNGTIDLSSSILPLVGDVVGIVTSNSIGSSYVYKGCMATLLPVQLTAFTAAKTNIAVLLSWKSEKEFNLGNYTIEHSLTGSDFKPIAVMLPQNNSSASSFYNFNHTTPGEINYYRLKMVNIDGSIKYSDIKMVRFVRNNGQAITVYPNPAKEFFNLHLDNTRKGTYTLSIIDAAGKLQLVQKLFVQQEQYENKIPITQLKAGNYSIIIYDNNGKRFGIAKSLMVE